jgi:tRNA pseudouridine38-40 synthase
MRPAQRFPHTLKLTLAYDGTAYVGWQRQATGTSVQGLLEEALTRLEGAPVACAAAGRTDAGVHALGQVASAVLTREMRLDDLQRALNAVLPSDIRVTAVDGVPADFHARFSARRKTYHYRIRNGGIVSPFERGYVWAIPSPLRLELMEEAAALLEGRHDFASFQAAGSDVHTTTRTVLRSRMRVEPGATVGGGAGPSSGTLVVYEITGDGFLRHMVRAIVGTLVDVGLGRRRPESVGELLEARDRAQAGPTAPACGLFLVAVDYGSIEGSILQET